MKIVWWIDSIALGGAQSWLMLITRELAKCGHEQTIISVNDRVDPRLLRCFAQDDIKFEVIGKVGLLSGYGILRIVSRLKKERFDAAITTLFFSDVIGLVISFLVRIPIRISAQQSSNQNFSAIRCLMLRSMLRLSHRIVLNSAEYLEPSQNRYLPANVPVDVIPNAVDIISDDHDMPSAEGKRCDRAFVLGMVGRLAAEKGHETAIRALGKLRHINVRLVMTGEGAYAGHLKQIASRAGVGERVEFLGHVNDIRGVYKKLDVLLQVSEYEGMPTAVLEAMAERCPVIATAVDGTKELVREGFSGWIVPVEDPDSLAETIERILHQPSEVERRTRNALVMVSERYNIKKIAPRWTMLLEEMSKNQSEGRGG